MIQRLSSHRVRGEPCIQLPISSTNRRRNFSQGANCPGGKYRRRKGWRASLRLRKGNCWARWKGECVLHESLRWLLRPGSVDAQLRGVAVGATTSCSPNYWRMYTPAQWDGWGLIAAVAVVIVVVDLLALWQQRLHRETRVSRAGTTNGVK